MMRRLGIILCFAMIACLISCDADSLQNIGNTSIAFGKNIIGAEKEYKAEKKALQNAGNNLLKEMTDAGGKVSIPEESGKAVTDMLSSINSFSKAAVVDTTTTTDGFTYEKKVDLSTTKMPEESQSDLKENMKEIFTSFSNVPSKMLSTAADENPIDKYSMKEVIDAAKARVEEFGSMEEYSSDTSIQNLVKLGRECLNGAENAIRTIVAHANESGNSITLEDVTIATIANVVKKEYGMLAVDKYVTGSQILSTAASAVSYFDALITLGVIPTFDVVELLTEFTNRH